MKHIFPKVAALLAVFVILVTALTVGGMRSASAQTKQVSSRAGTLTSLRNQGEQQCVQPPQHLSLTTLSDTQLSLYGLPPRNILESAPAFWSIQLAHYQHRTCGTGPTLPTHRVRRNVTGYATGNWAGNVTSGSRGTYREAMVTFKVPKLPALALVGSGVAIWAGVGGSYATPTNYGLVQAGVQVIEESGYQYNYALWEFVTNGYDTGPQHLTLPVYPGDTISVFVSSNFQGDGYDYFQVCDQNHGVCNSPNLIYGDFSDSASGECIVEKNLSLAWFGSEELTGCDIESNAGTFNGIGNWPHNYYYIVDTSGTQVAVGSITGGDSYPLIECATQGHGNNCG